MKFPGVTVASTTALAAALLAAPAFAPSTADAATTAAPAAAGEIVVSALRRDQRLQDAPLAITAFDAQAIQNAGIERPADFIVLTSNVTLVETQNAGNASSSLAGSPKTAIPSLRSQ